MTPPKSNSRLESDEKHSVEQSFHERRNEHAQYFPDNEDKTTALVDDSMYDDGVYTFTGVAQEARVIRAPPEVQRDKAEVPRYIAPSDKSEEGTESPVMGRPGNVPSPTGTINVPAYKTKPMCDWTKADLDEEDRDFRRPFAQMMNKQALNHNERPDPDPPESIEPARIGTLINESLIGSINGIDQTVDVADNPMAGEDCVRTSSQG
jgi:hypothetical protein